MVSAMEEVSYAPLAPAAGAEGLRNCLDVLMSPRLEVLLPTSADPAPHFSVENALADPV